MASATAHMAVVHVPQALLVGGSGRSAGSMKSNAGDPTVSVPPSFTTFARARVPEAASAAATKSPIPSPRARRGMSGVREVRRRLI